MKLKILADESVEYRIVKYLRSLNYDVNYISETTPSSEEDKILALASRESYILITNDKDFGYLIYVQKKKHKGVILLRFLNQETNFKIKFLKDPLRTFKLEEFKNKFAVISERGVRIRA